MPQPNSRFGTGEPRAEADWQHMKPSYVTRRRFLLSAAAVAAASLTGCSRREPPSEQPIDVVGDQRQSGDPLWLPSTGAWLIDDSSGTARQLAALAGQCPNDQRLVGWCTSVDTFVCPLCASSYDRSGAYLSGPSQQGLANYAVSVTDTGDVIVDPAKLTPGTKSKQLRTAASEERCASDLVTPTTRARS